jgi:hypothetical protein
VGEDEKKKKMTNLNSVFIEARSPSPDCSVKPFAGLLTFFLEQKSDQRELFLCLRKKQQDKKAWNEKPE